MKLKLTLLFFSTCFLASGQTERDVIKKAIQRVAEIKSCSYVMYQSTKLNSMRDTAYETGAVYFKYVQTDSLMGMNIHIENYKGITDIYNGDDFIKIRRTDSAVYIWKATDFPSIKHSLMSDKFDFIPFFKKSNMLTDAVNDSSVSLRFLKDTIIDSEAASVILFSASNKTKGQNEMKVLVTMYFRKIDYIPVGYTQKIISAKDMSLVKFEKVMLENLKINQKIEDKLFKMDAPLNYTLKQQTSQNIKNYIVISDAISHLSPEVFLNTKSYPYLKDKTLLLILINDTASYPCVKSLELLDSLYPLIKDKVLPIVISKTPVNLNYAFINEQRKYYSEFFNANQLLTESKICTYPTFIILNKQLKTVYNTEGYQMQLKQQLLNQIEHLN